MNPTHVKLIEGHLEGVLLPEEQGHLAELLRTDEAMQREFVLRSHLHRQLFDALHVPAKAFAAALADESLEDSESVTLPVVAVDRGWRSAVMRVAAVIAVATFFYGSFTLLAWNLRPLASAAKIATADAADAPKLATLTSTTDCQWIDSAVLPTGVAIGPQCLRLASGSADIEFADGALVRLHGPAELQIESGSRGYLRHGKLLARVPQQAIGFTIQTASTVVVDLGTEFAVAADSEGETEVQVLEGAVELRPTKAASDDKQSPPAKSVRLAAGSARRITASADGAVVVQEIPYKQGMKSLAASGVKLLPLRIEGVIASTEFPKREARNLINGSGMRDGAHGNVAEGAMWLALEGKVGGEFVLFDLYRLRRLHLMKVWNYNEAHAEEGEPYGDNRLSQVRGVAQADIYVSRTGRGNPLTDANDWQPIAMDHQFKPANGTDNYATPEEVALGGVEARFVAIVIDNHFSADPTNDGSAGLKYVGLSEVQFFGEPSVSSSNKPFTSKK